MARKLAERLMKERHQPGDRLDHAFELLTCRKPTRVEKTACLSLWQRMGRRYVQNPTDAAALLSLGEAPRDETYDVPELAALTQVCATILASDQVILLY